MIIQNVIESINNTPLIELKRIYKGQGHLFAKMEHLQPGGSIKDRAALQIIKDAYANGRLVTNQHVIEQTSGNMGSGLAVVCMAYRNPFTAVMSVGNSSQRVKILKALGAEVILVPQVDGEPGKVTGADILKAQKEAIETAIKINAFYVDQFNNHSSYRAHYFTTGPELLSDLKDRFNAFIAIVGSGGTFIGTSKFLKEESPLTKCIAVEPENSAIIKTGVVKESRHIIQGTGYGLIPPLWDDKVVDDIITVTDEEVSVTREQLGTIEGLFVGYSSGANVAAAIKHLEQVKNGNYCVATILCDTGFKY
jgi:cysteine synthase